MHPFQNQYSEGSAVKVKPSLDLYLKPGWRFDADERVFISPEDRKIKPGKLPARSKIVHKIVSLAKADPADLSEDEQLLARSMQIILPRAQDVDAALNAVRGWEAVASVQRPPIIGLPKMVE